MKNIILACLVGFFAFASTAYAESHRSGVRIVYTVEITNITKGVYFTPFLTAAHRGNLALLEVGEEASEPLAAIAEGGDIAPMIEYLESRPRLVNGLAQSEGLLAPGASVRLRLVSDSRMNSLSLASMLLPTNDTFVALNSVALPRRGSAVFYANAYDAGSEMNDELCMSIPGPQCGGAPFSPEDDGEGYVYPSPGIHGEGELTQSAYDWQGPVAKVVVKRVR